MMSNVDLTRKVSASKSQGRGRYMAKNSTSASTSGRGNDSNSGTPPTGEADGVWGTVVEFTGSFIRATADLYSNRTGDGEGGGRRFSPIKAFSIAIVVILAAWSANEYFKPLQDRGVLLCNLNSGDDARYKRGEKIAFKSLFDHSIEIDGITIDHRLVSIRGFEAKFRPEKSEELDCEHLPAQRDRVGDHLSNDGSVSGTCYVRALKSDFPVSVGVIAKDAVKPQLLREAGMIENRDWASVVEVRRISGAVDYLPSVRCSSENPAPPEKKLTLQQSAQRWVDLWLGRYPFPRNLRDRGITKAPVDVYIVRRRDNRGEFVCHGRDVRRPVALEAEACRILNEGQGEIMRRMDSAYYPMEKTKIIINIRDPQMESSVMSSN